MSDKLWQSYMGRQLTPFEQALASAYADTTETLNRPVTWIVVIAVIAFLLRQFFTLPKEWRERLWKWPKG